MVCYAKMYELSSFFRWLASTGKKAQEDDFFNFLNSGNYDIHELSFDGKDIAKVNFEKVSSTFVVESVLKYTANTVINFSGYVVTPANLKVPLSDIYTYWKQIYTFSGDPIEDVLRCLSDEELKTAYQEMYVFQQTDNLSHGVITTTLKNLNSLVGFSVIDKKEVVNYIAKEAFRRYIERFNYAD